MWGFNFAWYPSHAMSQYWYVDVGSYDAIKYSFHLLSKAYQIQINSNTFNINYNFVRWTKVFTNIIECLPKKVKAHATKLSHSHKYSHIHTHWKTASSFYNLIAQLYILLYWGVGINIESVCVAYIDNTIPKMNTLRSQTTTWYNSSYNNILQLKPKRMPLTITTVKLDWSNRYQALFYNSTVIDFNTSKICWHINGVYPTFYNICTNIPPCRLLIYLTLLVPNHHYPFSNKDLACYSRVIK